MRNHLAFLTMLCLGLPAAAFAGDKAQDWSRQYHQKMYDYYNEQLQQAEYELQEAQGLTTMTGNWNGARLYLLQHGVTISSSFVTDSVGNPVGGKAKGFSYAGSFGLSLGIDFERAAGWKGFSFYSSAVWRTGTSLSQRKIGNQFAAQQCFGSQTVKLNELYLQQIFGRKRITVKAGRLDAGNDFLASPLYAEFVSNAFDGNPNAIFFNMPSFTAYPNATWGGYLSVLVVPQLLIKFAAYNANSNIFANKYHGVNFTFKSTNGALLITEWAALVNQGSTSRGMPGNYKAGFIYQTGDVKEFQNGVVDGNYTYYFLIDQMIYRPNGSKTTEGLTPFAALLFSPGNRNTFPFFGMGGLVYKGLIKGRPRDTTNLGIAYGRYSGNLRNVERISRTTGMLGPYGNQPQKYEMVLEFNHWFQINDWFTFTPDVQYIINPKGYGNIQNALVLGAQVGVVL